MPADQTWKIEFTLMGGFTGLQRMSELSNDGRMTVTNLKSKKQVTVQLSDDEVTKIAGLMIEAARLQPVSDLPACADCFQYELQAQVDASHFTFLVNDINLNKSGLASLVQELKDLQERALSGQLDPGHTMAEYPKS